MTETTVYPGIFPVMSYWYDMTRAGVPSRTIGPITANDRYMWQLQSRILLAYPVYGIAQYVAPDGVQATVDGGILTFHMYDFCGGMLVSSGFIHSWPRAAATDSFLGRNYRTWKPGLKDRSLRESCSSTQFPKASEVIPSLSAYTGQETHTQDQAETAMRKSLAAGIISLGMSSGRQGIFAADIESRDARTRPIMEEMHGIHVPYYSRTGGVQHWANQDDFNKALVLRPVQPRSLSYAAVDVTTTSSYVNPNSGRRVSMVSATLRSGPALASFKIPEVEVQKFDSPELIAMCPQGLFHN